MRVYQLPSAQVCDHGIKCTEASSGCLKSLSKGLIKLLTAKKKGNRLDEQMPREGKL